MGRAVIFVFFQLGCFAKQTERMYPLHLEHSFRLDSREINIPMEVPITLDGKSFGNLRLGFNGYIGAMNSSKDYRIIPIFLMNYDLSLAGGIVRYTEKEKGAFRRDLIGQTQQLFNMRLDDPKCILVTWDDMVPTNYTQCYKKKVTNQFQAALLWEEGKTFLFVNFERLEAAIDCNTNNFAMMEINVDQKLRASFRHQLSRTSKVTNLAKHSNYEKAGHFAYQIHSDRVLEPYDWRENMVRETNLL